MQDMWGLVDIGDYCFQPMHNIRLRYYHPDMVSCQRGAAENFNFDGMHWASAYLHTALQL